MPPQPSQRPLDRGEVVDGGRVLAAQTHHARASGPDGGHGVVEEDTGVGNRRIGLAGGKALEPALLVTEEGAQRWRDRTGGVLRIEVAR